MRLWLLPASRQKRVSTRRMKSGRAPCSSPLKGRERSCSTQCGVNDRRQVPKPAPQWISPWRSTGSLCGQGAKIPERPKRVTFGAQVNRALVYGVLQSRKPFRHWRISTYPQKSAPYLLLYLLNLKKYRRTKHKAAEGDRGAPGKGRSPRTRGAWTAGRGKCTVRKRALRTQPVQDGPLRAGVQASSEYVASRVRSASSSQHHSPAARSPGRASPPTTLRCRASTRLPAAASMRLT